MSVRMRLIASSYFFALTMIVVKVLTHHTIVTRHLNCIHCLAWWTFILKFILGRTNFSFSFAIIFCRFLWFGFSGRVCLIRLHQSLLFMEMKQTDWLDWKSKKKNKRNNKQMIILNENSGMEHFPKN